MPYITKIQVGNLLHLRDLNINLSEGEHLILTGKNGSGKSILLDAIHNNLPRSRSRSELPNTDLTVEFKDSSEQGLYSYFEAFRRSNMIDPTKSDPVDEMKFDRDIRNDPSRFFVKYIVDMHTKRTDAYYYWKEHEDDDSKTNFDKLEEWFKDLEESLQIIFADNEISLEYNREKKNFEIHENGKLPYTLNQLSTGYSAILTIVANILLKMDRGTNTNYDVEGVVVIDEVETHLHVALQKIIMPFLTNFFPKVQFIVSTHSPFVLSSIKSAVIFDMEHQLSVEPLFQHSYTSILESYFNVDEYSEEIKSKYNRYKLLKDGDIEPGSDEEIEIHDFEKFLNNIPTSWAQNMKLDFLLEDLNRGK